ncbi:MAG: hypothetical protein ACTSYX_03690 [Candidatus Thorarchaeota archaeon]
MKRSVLGATALVMLLIMTTPLAAVPRTGEHFSTDRELVTADFTPAKILFDESHTANGSSFWAPGNASLFSWMLGVNGYNSSTNFDDPLDSGILDNFDVLVIFFPMKNLTSAEVAAVKSFVENGGGLLMVGIDAKNAWAFRSTFLNTLSTEFGITFNSDEIRGVADSLNTHQITEGITDILLDGDQLYSCSLSLDSSGQSIIEKDGQTVAAVTEHGSGRVVAVGSPAPFYMYRKGTYGHGPNDFQFSLNVIDWLTGNSYREADIPDIATITVGDGPSFTAEELDKYQMFVGLYHDHTTHSDGRNTVEEMVEAGLNKALDFMILTDHSYDKPVSIGGMTGGAAAKALVERYGIDILEVPGAELSTIKHTTGFPLKENVFTDDQKAGVDGIHAQGAIATFAHPTIDPTYAPVYELFDYYGFDAIEVDNMGFFYGAGEEGFFRNFLGASDGHSASYVGTMMNVVFVKNPSGPDGRLNASDIVDAVLNRRVVILDRENSLVYGQRVWVDKYMNTTEEAANAIDAAEDIIDARRDAGYGVGLSEMYLEAAKDALLCWNPARALRLAQNATSAVALGLDLQVTFPSAPAPNEQFPINITLTNDLDYGISLNSSLFVISSLTVDAEEINQVLEVGNSSTASVIRNTQCDESGFVAFWLNIHSFNTTEYLMPVLFRVRSPIDNVEWVIDEDDHTVEIRWLIDVAARSMISSAYLTYNDGAGKTTVKMYKGWNYYNYYLGPYDHNTTIVFNITIVDMVGHVTTLSNREVTIVVPATTTTTTTTSETTTTTTTTSGTSTGTANTTGVTGGLSLGLETIAVMVGGVAAIVIVVLVLIRKR